MFERHGKESLYPRQQVMGWLGWLARGMQAHSQSIFMLDDLQPSWLGSTPGRWGYLLLTRPLWGGLWGALNGAALALGALWVAVRGLGMSEASQFSYGLGLVGMLAGLFAMLGGLAGLAQALANGVRMQRRARRAPETIPAQASRSETLVDFIANGAPPGLVTGGFLALFVAGLAQIGRLIAGQGYTGFEWAVWLQLVALGAAAALVVFGLSWGSSGVDYRADIRLVEILQWSWARAGRGVLWGWLAGLAAGLVFGWIVGAFDSSLLWPVVLLCGAPLGLVGAGIFGLAAGLRGRSVEVQITPDSGIRRSARYAALSGLLMGLGGAGLAVIAMGLSLWLVGRAVPAAQGNTGLVDFGLVFSLLAGVQIAFIGMMRTGGLATLQHGLLFALLAAGGHLPWRLIHFLDYAADLILVHRVGGGYVFTHRLLMEHILLPASPNQPAAVGEEHPPGQQ